MSGGRVLLSRALRANARNANRGFHKTRLDHLFFAPRRFALLELTHIMSRHCRLRLTLRHNQFYPLDLKRIVLGGLVPFKGADF